MTRNIVRSARWTHLVSAAAVVAGLSMSANAFAQSSTTSASTAKTQNALTANTASATTPPATPVAAQPDYLDLGIGIHIGTAGYGVEVNKLLFSHLGIRADFNYFSLSKNETNNDIAYTGKIKLETVPILLDLYTGNRGSFHLTGGYVFDKDNVSVTGSPNAEGDYTINHDNYSADEVGTLTGGIVWPKSGGYAGLGWGTPARNHPFTVTFDLGTIISTPKFDLTASGATAGSQLQDDLNAQSAKTQTDVNKIKIYPVIALGLMYRL